MVKTLRDSFKMVGNCLNAVGIIDIFLKKSLISYISITISTTTSISKSQTYNQN